MTWFKVDDKLHDHRKTRAAGKAAMGVWVLAGSWAADNLTDGFVPASVLSRWGTRADASKLVAAGLWHQDEQDGEKGWRFHQWSEGGRQPTRVEMLARREARAEAGRLGGQASGRTRREAKPKQVASAVVEPPSRPVPGPSDAAAASPAGQPASDDLPPAVAILRGALEAHKLVVQWSNLTAAERDELTVLVGIHGDNALVQSALRSFQPAKPPATAKAWLGQWRDLRAPGDLAVVTEPCPEPGHSGTTKHCTQCASERLERKTR